MVDRRGLPADDRPQHPRQLPDWLIGHGRHWLTVPQGAELLSLPTEQVPAAIARLRGQGTIFSPTPGGYVPVPPEYRSWGAVPASHFIDPWMCHLGHAYYVGYLSAAEIHGVAHQRPQVFQVVTDARMRERAFGRVRIQFIRSLEAGQRPTVPVNTPTGTMHVATSEVTVLDLATHPRHGGGLSNVATVLSEMLQEGLLDLDTLARVAASYPAATRQRAGWLLQDAASHLSLDVDLSPLEALARRRSTPTPLDASGRRRGPIDPRWNVLVNAEVEPDL